LSKFSSYLSCKALGLQLVDVASEISFSFF